MHDVIFESDTPAGMWFDVALLIAILCSVVVVSTETLPSYEGSSTLYRIEWLLTILFTIEYVARLICARHPIRYAVSFWGIVDLLSILPTYAGLILEGSGSFVILRSIRLLRVFRVLKLWRMMDDADELSHAVWKARHKVVVFLIVVLVAVTISGTLMFFIENQLQRVLAKGDTAPPASQFSSIPQSMYWAIVTMTTVGYGDIVPQTTVGKFISAALILLGYSLIIVPTGFVTAELKSSDTDRESEPSVPCPRCETRGHRADAVYCFRCGQRL
ncbi:ion transporter [Roseiconus nitratireducens]|nr:ion transporter [Roseiconus nitratireducens]